MNIVLQEEKTGCGFAVVAMISGKNSMEVKQLANSQGIFSSDEKLFTSTDYVRRLLAGLGVELSESEVNFTNWKNLPSVALLATKHRVENRLPRWHWSIYEKSMNRVLDPASYLENNKRVDFENIKVEWYIEVKK